MHIFSQCGRASLAIAVLSAIGISRAQPPAVSPGPDGKLVYAADERGNRIPDFSNCGYAGADRDIPDVPTVVSLAPSGGDDTARIQAAIDYVAQMPLSKDGFRGAVELAPGEFRVAGQLTLNESGIVLRGAGAGDGGTKIIAMGASRRSLIRVPEARGMVGLAGSEFDVSDDYVPVGAKVMHLHANHGIHVGDRVVITRPSTKAWIKTLGMNAFGVGWRPGSAILRWERFVTSDRRECNYSRCADHDSDRSTIWRG